MSTSKFLTQHRVILAQWYICNSVRILTIPILFVVNMLYTNQSDQTRCNRNETESNELVAFDEGYFTGGLMIDVINFLLCYVCLALSRVNRWRSLIPFLLYAFVDLIFSIYFAYLVFSRRIYSLPFFGYVHSSVVISAVTFALVAKIYHFSLANIVTRKSFLLVDSSSLPLPPPPP